MPKLFGQAFVIALSAGLTAVFGLVIVSMVVLQYTTPAKPDGKGSLSNVDRGHWVCLGRHNFVLPNTAVACTLPNVALETLTFSIVAEIIFILLAVVPVPQFYTVFFYGWIFYLTYYFNKRVTAGKPIAYLRMWGLSIILAAAVVPATALVFYIFTLWK